jgi:hypothetical protein
VIFNPEGLTLDGMGKEELLSLDKRITAVADDGLSFAGALLTA